ncbi:MAG: hypothetical protein LJE97_19250 [Betaproteobacteria bacterium]|nr:hypothetical protein [Betaproteobacteria bacterium]
MLRTSAALAGLTCLTLMAPGATLAAERWFLMSRHGDCVEIGVLKRKVPDLGEVSSPDGFASFMRQKGYEVTSTQVPVRRGKAQEVKVPQKELSLIFVTSEMCSGHETR